MVERNLGFEAEHHERALRDIPGTRHRIDHQAKRFGILTTEDIKYGMMTLLNTMLRDQRVNVKEPLLSEDPLGNRKRLREQLIIYSFQYKAAANAFGKQRVAFAKRCRSIDPCSICRIAKGRRLIRPIHQNADILAVLGKKTQTLTPNPSIPDPARTPNRHGRRLWAAGGV